MSSIASIAYNAVGGALSKSTTTKAYAGIIVFAVITTILMYFLFSYIFKTIWNNVFIKYFPNLKPIDSLLDAFAFLMFVAILPVRSF